MMWPRWVWAVLFALILVVVGIFLYARFADQQADVAVENVEQGRTIEREAVQSEVLENVEKANAVREEARAGSRVDYDQCMSSSRPAARPNCERFLPR